MNPSAAWRHETPRIGTKYDYAKAHGQAQRTAQKRLTAMHKRGEVWVSGWAKHLHQWVPVYSTGSGTDVPKPAHIAVCKDPLVACGLCLLYDTTEADKTHVW